jgi:hypothetical protein
MEKTKPVPQIQVKQDPSLLETTVYFFNRFKIRREGMFRILYLGSVIDGESISSHVVAMAEHDIITCYNHSKTYLAALGEVSQESPKDWSIPRTNMGILAANILNFSHSGPIAELLFSNVVIHELACISQGIKKEREVAMRRLLIARTDMTLHKQFLGNFFDGIE